MSKTHQTGKTLRVLTYNIKSLRLDRAAARRVIVDAAPDVVLIQETPRWLMGPARMARFARECGLDVAVGGRGGRGVAILLRPQLSDRVVAAQAVAFESRFARFHRGWPAVRGYALVRIAPLGSAAAAPEATAQLTLVSAHFSADPAARARHRRVYRDLVSRESPALVLGGDLNEHPNGPSLAVLIPPLRHADPHQGPTSPVNVPRTRLDAFLVGDAVDAGPAQVLGGPDVLTGSDHRPVLISVSHRAWS